MGNHKFYLGCSYYGYKILNAESFTVNFSGFTYPSSVNIRGVQNRNLNEEYIYIDNSYYAIGFSKDGSGHSYATIIKSSSTNLEGFNHPLIGTYFNTS